MSDHAVLILLDEKRQFWLNMSHYENVK